jgi:hypothetical protein
VLVHISIPFLNFLLLMFVCLQTGILLYNKENGRWLFLSWPNAIWIPPHEDVPKNSTQSGNDRSHHSMTAPVISRRMVIMSVTGRMKAIQTGPRKLPIEVGNVKSEFLQKFIHFSRSFIHVSWVAFPPEEPPGYGKSGLFRDRGPNFSLLKPRWGFFHGK